VVRTIDGERELIMMRWGMPPPPKFGGPPVTNICNTASPHWRGMVDRCIVAANRAQITRRGEKSGRTLTNVATFVKFDLQEQIPSPRCSFNQLPIA
jgi:putative SOS response-associated peptidase YedK